MFRRRETSGKTTDTLLQEEMNASVQNVVLSAGDIKYLVSTQLLKLMGWAMISDYVAQLKDDSNDPFFLKRGFREALKALLRYNLPKILAKSGNADVTIPQGLDVLEWVPSFIIHKGVNLLAASEWRAHVEACEGCGDNVYRIVGISPHSYGLIPSPADANNETSDRESIQRRGQQSSSREEDSNQLRGPVGGSGRP